jgi:hypothetical protein
MCLSLEPYDVERLEQLCQFTSRLVLVITWFTLPSPFLKLYHSITHPPSHSFPLGKYFCGVGKCDPFSVFLLIESLLAACIFHPFFVTWSSSYKVSPLLLFNPCFFFLGSFFLLGRDSTHWNFLGESHGK